MNKILFQFISKIRACITKRIKPKRKDILTRSLYPISNKYGFDRGKPIDRYYIESFLKENKKYIKGRCLEIHDHNYTFQYGRNKVTQSDVLDIDSSNKQANIHSDLRNLKEIGNDVYDCLLITHTLGMIDDFNAAIKECKRILKKGGTLLVTTSLIAPILNYECSIWKFTEPALKYIFKKYFDEKSLFIKSYGNVFSAQCFLTGLSSEELDKSELEYIDRRFPVIIALRVTKTV